MFESKIEIAEFVEMSIFPDVKEIPDPTLVCVAPIAVKTLVPFTNQTPGVSVIEHRLTQEFDAAADTLDAGFADILSPTYPAATAVPSPADCNNDFCVMFSP
jgi:hypothetical protein